VNANPETAGAMKRSLIPIVFFLCLFGVVLGEPASAEPVKNVILYLAPGLGPHQYRLLEGIVRESGKDLALAKFDRRLKMTTGILGADRPDREGAGSTLATGWLCPPGLLSVTADGLPLPTVLERAQLAGRSIGLITLGDLTQGALTPFAVHGSSDLDLEQRARQLFDGRVQVLIGRDREVFQNAHDGDGRPLLERMVEEGYTLAESDRRKFLTAKGTHLIAFFDHVFRVDQRFYPMEPGLAQILIKSLSILRQNPKGFFLVVEAAGLDLACRMNDPAGLANELLELDEAVEAGINFAGLNPETLVVVAPPYEAGNFFLVEDQLPHFIEQYQTIQCSPVYLDQQIGGNNDATHVLKQFLEVMGVNFLERSEMRDMVSLKPGPQRVQRIASVVSHHVTGGYFAQSSPSARSVPLFVHGPGSDRWPPAVANHQLAGLLARALDLPE